VAGYSANASYPYSSQTPKSGKSTQRSQKNNPQPTLKKGGESNAVRGGKKTPRVKEFL